MFGQMFTKANSQNFKHCSITAGKLSIQPVSQSAKYNNISNLQERSLKSLMQRAELETTCAIIITTFLRPVDSAVLVIINITRKCGR